MESAGGRGEGEYRREREQRVEDGEERMESRGWRGEGEGGIVE